MSSYADHIELKYGNSQRWLVKFLREGYSDRYWKSHQPFISIYILDSIAGVLHGQTFKASRAGPVDPTFLLALKSRPANSRTRLVLTQCGQLGDTNGAYIDAIAEQFQLDPMFLCAHFQRCLYLTEGSDIGGATQLPVAAPSERNFISIRQGGSDSHMTATITASSKSNSIVLLGLDHLPPERVTHMRDYLLNHFSLDDVAKGDQIPCDYLYPYIGDSLRTLAQLTQKLGHDDISGGSKPPISIHWEWNESNLRALVSSKESIKLYLSKFTDWRSSRLKGALKDSDALIAEAERSSTYMQGKLQRYENNEAIKEAKKNLQLADSVRRLALVGFIFIPLTFATSFFGMNLNQLGTGSVHLGYFFLLAALSGSLAFVLAACITPTEEAWMRARRRFQIREFNGDDTDYEWVTKSMIFWAWVRRHSTIATKINNAWFDEKEKLMTERGNWFPEEIHGFTYIVFGRFCLALGRKMASKVFCNRGKIQESED